MSRLQNRLALVTGASSGIGRAIARALAAEGAKVALVARTEAKLQEAAAEIGPLARAFPADLTEKGAPARLVAEVQAWAPIDILIANAGIYFGGDVAEADPPAIDQLIETNVTSVFQLIRAALPAMLERREGDVLVTSSVSGHQAIPWEPVYSASKHAVQSFVHGLRQQVGPQGLRVLSLAPGIVLNDLWGISSTEEIAAKVARGEGLRSEDAADAALWMLTRPRHVTVRDLVILPRAQPI